MEELKEILQSQYRFLPQDLKQTVVSDGWRGAVRSISSQNGLDLDSADSVETEVLLVITGLASLKDFGNNLSKTLLLPKEKTDRVAQAIEQQVFSGIRNSLEKLQEEIESEKEEGVREEMQHEIEHPQKTAPAFEKRFSVPQSENIIDDKLGKVVKLPHEKSENATGSPKPTDHYGEGDPYREPIE